LRTRLAHAEAGYARARDALVPAGSTRRPIGGVGGARFGIKCLHAHLAHFLAGGDNPVGEVAARSARYDDCERRCVEVSAAGAPPRRVPEWREPTPGGERP
jgi:hypothetical protein